MATVHPREKPSGQNVSPMGESWDETSAVRNAAQTGQSTPEEIVRFSEDESDKRTFHPLLYQAHRIIIGVALFAILVSLLGHFFYQGK